MSDNEAPRRLLWVSWCDGFRWTPYEAWLREREGHVTWPTWEPAMRESEVADVMSDEARLVLHVPEGVVMRVSGWVDSLPSGAPRGDTQPETPRSGRT